MRKPKVQSRQLVLPRPTPKHSDSSESGVKPSPHEFVQIPFDLNSLLDDAGEKDA